MWTWIIVGVVLALVLLLCLALAVASFAFDNFMEKHQEMSQKRNSYRITTLEYVQEVNDEFFGGKLKVARCANLQDHYSSGVVAMSGQTMTANNLASLAIVSHELGHARQDQEGNALKKHWKLRRTGRLLSRLFIPLLIAGAIFSLLYVFGVLEEQMYLWIGLAFAGMAFLTFLFALFVKYKEIKIEKQASDYALEFLKKILSDKELKDCKEFLNSARLTYWASLIRTMLFLSGLANKNS